MKKALYFNALIALCCVFYMQADKTYATSGAFSIYQDGRMGPPYEWYIVPDFTYNSGDSCIFHFFEGFWPSEASPAGDGVGGCAGMFEYPDHTFVLSDAGVDRHIWIKIEDVDLSTRIDYYPIDYDSAMDIWYSSTGQHVSISSPVLGSTATSTASYLTGTWTGIDTDIFKNITLYFTNSYTGESATAQIVATPTSGGSFSIPLRDFDFSSDGTWNLKTNATYKNTQLSDMIITSDLTTGYYLILDIAGLHTPYMFTDFITWYHANVPNYSDPTDWAVAMVGYLQPVLQKIAEFGARITDYLDITTSHQRGKDLGSVLSVVNAYVEKINIFFGGFPIVQFFQWGVLLMMGLFAVKFILKLLAFIPFFGGGG